MALNSSTSALVSLILTVSVFSGMQLYRHQLASSGPFTILGGFLGSVIFLFSLTALGNFGAVAFGQGYQASLFPEAAVCLVLALFASGRVHGVCITTCFIFSLIHLYYTNRISQKAHNASGPASNVAVTSGKKKK